MTAIQAAVVIAGMACVAILAVVGCLTGHDGPLLTAAVASITGTTGATIGYRKGVSTGFKRALHQPTNPPVA